MGARIYTHRHSLLHHLHCVAMLRRPPPCGGENEPLLSTLLPRGCGVGFRNSSASAIISPPVLQLLYAASWRRCTSSVEYHARRRCRVPACWVRRRLGECKSHPHDHMNHTTTTETTDKDQDKGKFSLSDRQGTANTDQINYRKRTY